MYKRIIRPILFCFNAETAHNIIFTCLSWLRCIPFAKWILRLIYTRKTPSLEREVFGIRFRNPVGLAGGLDKNGEHYNELADFGFGFIEIGSLTPEPQPGNPKPRLFRVVKDKAIINRMGINNKGVRNAVEHLKKYWPKVLNISCPNVVGLSALQDVSFLADIVDKLLNLRMYFDEYRPILIKVSPDIPHQQLDEIIDYAMMSGIDGIVAGNTTRSRDGLKSLSAEEIEEIGNGGLSGAPLYEKNLALVRYIHDKTRGRLPIIGVGGIMSGSQAAEMLDAGASLVEIYTGFIYEGPAIVRKINSYLQKRQKK